MHHFLCTAITVLLLIAPTSSAAVDRYGVYEATLTSAKGYADPSADVNVHCDFTAPSGKQFTVDAFWDGGRAWKVRFSPTQTGKWRWKSYSTDESNSGLHARSGTFDCTRYAGDNPLMMHGPLKVSARRTHLSYSDGKPFFWLADTSWNGVLKARAADWEQYLAKRRDQGFTAVQFVCIQWRSFDQDTAGERAYTGSTPVRINPEFFRRLDSKVAAINRYGMVAAPVMLWAYGTSDPGQALAEEDAMRVARYIHARWGAYNVVWILAGDGQYTGNKADRWRRIGRSVFGDAPSRIATMHPGGLQWVGDEFRGEPWMGLIGYQSGHGTSAGAVNWLVSGPPAADWEKRPSLPIINLEPNYEGILAYGSKQPIDALAVRKALYRSLLVAPTAGVTYGHHGIWFWTDEPVVPTAHPNSGIAAPWKQAMVSEGAVGVSHLARLFGSVRWWTLRPEPGLVKNRSDDPLAYIASAMSEDRSLAIVYMPGGGSLHLDGKLLKPGLRLRWFDPTEGTYTSAGAAEAAVMKLAPPRSGDWVLVVGG